MSPESQQRIRESWTQIEPQAGRFADVFYTHLFDLDPQVRAMFAATDMTAQRRKFVVMLATLVDAVDKPPDLVAELTASGRRHVDYGVEDPHYAAVGSALLRTLEQCLGPDFDASTRQAWRELYTLVAALMRRGADHIARGVTTG